MAEQRAMVLFCIYHRHFPGGNEKFPWVTGKQISSPPGRGCGCFSSFQSSFYLSPELGMEDGNPDEESSLETGDRLPNWQGARGGFQGQEVSHSRALELIDSQKILSWLHVL